MINERVYEELIRTAIQPLTLPLSGVVLITAFGKKSNRIKNQALLEVQIGEDKFESVFLIVPQLINDMIIGCQLLQEYGIIFDFTDRALKYVKDGITKKYAFESEAEKLTTESNARRVQESAAQGQLFPRTADLIPLSPCVVESHDDSLPCSPG